MEWLVILFLAWLLWANGYVSVRMVEPPARRKRKRVRPQEGK